MQNLTLSNLSGFMAVSFITISYFTNQKSTYLLYQSISIIFLSLSYYFSLNYFAMVGLILALFRTITFYFYEKLNKVVPIFVCIIFSILTLCCYFVINFKILKTANVKDVIFLIALILIIFIYRLKNESKIRLLLIISTSLNVIYNFVSVSPLFSTLTYVFEFFANLIAIFIYQVFPSIRNKNRAVIKNTIERA